MTLVKYFGTIITFPVSLDMSLKEQATYILTLSQRYPLTGVIIMIEMDMTKKATATTCTLRPSRAR